MVLHGFGKAESQVQFLLGAPTTGFGEMDIITVFETAGRGSIPLSPTNLAVVQWIVRLPPKRQIQVRFLSAGPNYFGQQT